MQVQMSPFAEQIVDKCKYSKKVHGVKELPVNGVVSIDFIVPYAKAKITTVEVIGCLTGDTANFKILDSLQNVLNQHGYDVVLPNNYYEQKSEFAGNLVQGMILRCEVTTSSSEAIGVNYILNEMTEVI